MNEIKKTGPVILGQRWKDFLSEFLEQASEASSRLYSILGGVTGQEDITAAQGEQESAFEAVQPVVSAFKRANAAFSENAPLKGTRRYTFAASELEHIRNGIVPAIGLQHHIKEGFGAFRSDIESAAAAFVNMLDPFQVIEKVYSIHSEVQRWIEVTAANIPKKAPVAGAAVRALVSEVLDTASIGAVRDETRAVISADWTPAIGALTFIDRTPGFEAFADFAPGREGGGRLIRLTRRAEDGFRTVIRTDETSKASQRQVSGITIYFPGPGEGLRLISPAISPHPAAGANMMSMSYLPVRPGLF